MQRRVWPILLCLSLSGCPATTPVAVPSAKPSSASAGAPQAAPTSTPTSTPTGTPAGASVDTSLARPVPSSLPSTPDTRSGVSGNQAPAPALRAGDVDDNADFAAYRTYLAGFRGTGVRTVDVSERITIRVTDASQKGVPDAEVTVAGSNVLFEGRTASDGRVLFFPKTYPAVLDRTEFSVRVKKNDSDVVVSQLRANQTWEIALPAVVDRAAAANLDLVFLLDATGSMGDEIGRIQSTIRTVTDRIKQLNGNQRVRLGMVAYRDREDSENLIVSDFTEDLGQFQARLASVKASGGGDEPEDLENGLNAAMGRMSWSAANATRLAFLVADAPPHVDYQQTTPYPDSIVRAVKQGVKLYPIGASGLNATGEYVFRQLAEQTLAKYLFLTYGGEPGPGGGVSATVGAYQENNLDDLIVSIVKRELAPLTQ